MIRFWYCSMPVRLRQSRRNRNREGCRPYPSAEQLGTNSFFAAAAAPRVCIEQWRRCQRYGFGPSDSGWLRQLGRIDLFQNLVKLG
jgi:hypothetical protein